MKFDPDQMKIFVKDMRKNNKEIEVIDLPDLTNAEPNSTGSFVLDQCLITPCPEGGFIEIFGDEASGKTTLGLEIIGNAVSRGKPCLIVDQERALQRSLVESIRSLRPYVEDIFDNSDTSPIRVIRAASGEAALEAVRSFATMFPGSVILIDSVDALVPSSKMDEKIGKPSVADGARLMSDALRILVHQSSKSNSTVIFLNQKRSKVGMFFGNPDVTGGGKALKYYAWQRIELLAPSNEKHIKNSDNVRIGHRCRFKVIKNKTGPTVGTQGDFPILYGKGIYHELELIEQCTKFGILKQGGKGGKQVLVPVVTKKDNCDDFEIKEKVMSRFNASRLLLIDDRTLEHIEGLYKDFEKMMNDKDLVEKDESEDS